MRVHVDKKKRVRVAMNTAEAEQILQVATDFKLHAVEPLQPYSWITFKALPPRGSALVPGRVNWTRTSFRIDKLLKEQTQSIAGDLGMTWCEYLRLTLQNARDLAILAIVPRKDKPSYVE